MIQEIWVVLEDAAWLSQDGEWRDVAVIPFQRVESPQNRFPPPPPPPLPQPPPSTSVYFPSPAPSPFTTPCVQRTAPLATRSLITVGYTDLPVCSCENQNICVRFGRRWTLSMCETRPEPSRSSGPFFPVTCSVHPRNYHSASILLCTFLGQTPFIPSPTLFPL